MKANNILKYQDEDFYERRTLDDKELVLLNIEKAKEALHVAYAKFDLVTEPELVDSCIYELKSIQLKYQYLIQQAKELGIIANSI